MSPKKKNIGPKLRMALKTIDCLMQLPNSERFLRLRQGQGENGRSSVKSLTLIKKNIQKGLYTSTHKIAADVARLWKGGKSLGFQAGSCKRLKADFDELWKAAHLDTDESAGSEDQSSEDTVVVPDRQGKKRKMGSANAISKSIGKGGKDSENNSVEDQARGKEDAQAVQTKIEEVEEETELAERMGDKKQTVLELSEEGEGQEELSEAGKEPRGEDGAEQTENAVKEESVRGRGSSRQRVIPTKYRDSSQEGANLTQVWLGKPRGQRSKGTLKKELKKKKAFSQSDREEPENEEAEASEEKELTGVGAGFDKVDGRQSWSTATGRPKKKQKGQQEVIDIGTQEVEALDEGRGQNEDMLFKELKKCLQIVTELMAKKEAALFLEPVDPATPDYLDVIVHPMDLGTVRKKLLLGPGEDGNDRYRSAFEVLQDLQLVWNNCREFNRKGDPILTAAWFLEDLMIKKWETAGLPKKPPELPKELPITSEEGTHLDDKTENRMLGKGKKKRFRDLADTEEGSQRSKKVKGEEAHDDAEEKEASADAVQHLEAAQNKEKQDDNNGGEAESIEKKEEAPAGEKAVGTPEGASKKPPAPPRFVGVMHHREGCTCVVCEGLRRRQRRIDKYGADLSKKEIAALKRARKNGQPEKIRPEGGREGKQAVIEGFDSGEDEDDEGLSRKGVGRRGRPKLGQRMEDEGEEGGSPGNEGGDSQAERSGRLKLARRQLGHLGEELKSEPGRGDDPVFFRCTDGALKLRQGPLFAPCLPPRQLRADIMRLGTYLFANSPGAQLLRSHRVAGSDKATTGTAFSQKSVFGIKSLVSPKDVEVAALKVLPGI